MFRVVIDPGVLIAGLISSRGAPRTVLWAWLEGAFELIASPKLLSELEEVLTRDKFRSYVTLRDVNAYLILLKRFATIAPDASVVSKLSVDPDDDYLLALASSQAADYLVSGDPHLTDIKTPPVSVLSPRAFLNYLLGT